MLIIDNAVVAELLTMRDCIAVQEKAFLGLASGESIDRPALGVYYPCEREDGYFRLGTMEGASGSYHGLRIKSDIVTWPKTEHGRTEEKYCIQPGTYCGLILLISTRTAEPLAFINDGVLQHMRVGGGAGIGVKYLARKDAHVVGMIGSGGMARTYLEAFTCVREIKQCRVFSPNAEHREAFAREMTAKLNIDVVPVSSPRAAAKGADILSACTTSLDPVIEADWLEPGMHVTNLNLMEMSPGALERFDVSIRQGNMGLAIREEGRFQIGRGGSTGAFIGGTEEQMRRIPQPPAGDHWRRADMPAFADLGSGKCAGRTSADQITFYRTVGNPGLQFSSVGGLVYELAVKQKRGRKIPTEWFLQDIRD